MYCSCTPPQRQSKAGIRLCAWRVANAATICVNESCLPRARLARSRPPYKVNESSLICRVLFCKTVEGPSARFSTRINFREQHCCPILCPEGKGTLSSAPSARLSSKAICGVPVVLPLSSFPPLLFSCPQPPPLLPSPSSGKPDRRPPAVPR